MKTKSTLTVLCVISAALLGASSARTWTSADGERTFQGDYVSSDGTKVTVRRSTGNITFELEKLSEADVAFVKEQIALAAAAEESAERRELPVPSEIAGKLKRLNGERLAKMEDSEVVPEFYFLAYTASW